jgi:uncharacterized protein (TIGR03382 family)
MIGFRPKLFARIREIAAPLSVIAVLHAAAVAAPSGFAPDAWTRANDSDTSYFGWDVLEPALPPNFYGALQVLDDSTPDLGSGITATNTRFYQGTDGANDTSPTANGHMSGSGNYYSFFDTANDTITGVAPGGAGGFTTVVLQVHSSSNGSLLDDLSFAMDESLSTWILHMHLNDAGAGDLGYHWIEWSRPGGNVPFAVTMTSTLEHRTIDSIEIDTFWTSGNAPAVNAVSQVPEPATAMLCLSAAGVGVLVRRRRHKTL